MNPLSQHIIIMGVCGCGKSTVGSVLADKLQWVFFDADDFHSVENITKMQSGIALNDQDRQEWLVLQKEHLIRLSQRGISSILASSALRASYREILSSLSQRDNYANTYISFVWLAAPIKIIRQRMKKRKHHFMSSKLIQSQFDTLEVPNEAQEHITCYRVDVTNSNVENIATDCMRAISINCRPLDLQT